MDSKVEILSSPACNQIQAGSSSMIMRIGNEESKYDPMTKKHVFGPDKQRQASTAQPDLQLMMRAQEQDQKPEMSIIAKRKHSQFINHFKNQPNDECF